MNSKLARQLRSQAKEAATEEYATTNINVNVKTMNSGRKVMNDEGVYVDELVPVVTFTTILKDNSARKIYKQLKGGAKHG